MKRVTILQPWLAHYRLPFFERLQQQLTAAGIELTVAHGDPPTYLRARGDSRSASWAVHLKGGPILGTRMESHSVRHVTKGRDLVIVEQAIRNLETYWLMGQRAFGGSPTAMWGHGRTYVKQQTRAELWLKDRLTKSADWFFAYTDGGADYVRALGYPPERITTVQNSIDTTALKDELSSVSCDEVKEFRALFGIPDRPHALYLGALDADKRVPMLLEVAEGAASDVTGFHLLVVGDGAEASLVRDAAPTASWLTYVGALHGRDKAIALKSSALLVNPGRVGLVAVDSFAAAVPLVTTDWPWHAPEHEYLIHGTNAYIAKDTVNHLKAGVAQVWNDNDMRADLSAGCRASADVYTLDEMVNRFARGVQAAVGTG